MQELLQGGVQMKTELNEIVSQEFKDEFKVLDKNETRRERIWKDCVEEAKVLVKTTHEIRMKIVALAEKCCVIHHGGSSTSNRYTVLRFATEIGMNPHTLLEWVRVKKNVYDELSPQDQKDIGATKLTFLDRQLKGEKRGTEQYKVALKKEVEKLKKTSASTIKMMKYANHMKTIIFNVKNKPMIKDCDEQILIEMLHLAREISWNLKYLDEKKEKYANV